MDANGKTGCDPLHGVSVSGGERTLQSRHCRCPPLHIRRAIERVEPAARLVRPRRMVIDPKIIAPRLPRFRGQADRLNCQRAIPRGFGRGWRERVRARGGGGGGHSIGGVAGTSRTLMVRSREINEGFRIRRSLDQIADRHLLRVAEKGLEPFNRPAVASRQKLSGGNRANIVLRGVAFQFGGNTRKLCFR